MTASAMYVSHREASTNVLGPGLRYALWLQGCEKNCPSCIFPEGRPLESNGEWLTVEKICPKIKNSPSLTGLTVSGGEPFLQSAALAEIKILRAESTLDVMICYTLGELQARKDSATDFYWRTRIF